MEQWFQKAMVEMQRSIHEIEKTLAAQHVSLVDHMRRTDLLEKRVDGLWLRVLSVAGGLVGIAVGAAKLLGQ